MIAAPRSTRRIVAQTGNELFAESEFDEASCDPACTKDKTLLSWHEEVQFSELRSGAHVYPCWQYSSQLVYVVQFVALRDGWQDDVQFSKSGKHSNPSWQISAQGAYELQSVSFNVALRNCRQYELHVSLSCTHSYPSWQA